MGSQKDTLGAILLPEPVTQLGKILRGPALGCTTRSRGNSHSQRGGRFGVQTQRDRLLYLRGYVEFQPGGVIGWDSQIPPALQVAEGYRYDLRIPIPLKMNEQKSPYHPFVKASDMGRAQVEGKEATSQAVLQVQYPVVTISTQEGQEGFFLPSSVGVNRIEMGAIAHQILKAFFDEEINSGLRESLTKGSYQGGGQDNIPNGPKTDEKDARGIGHLRLKASLRTNL